ncbi:MAG: transcription elongation factor Spt5 [Candidatus Aenigmarchaeota archaeon]|nr:transcription elongation factor Spt5 [Candidatus Aenigmarchaeota archaeon]MCX8179435.1 transcription elongation factor Spt5 [Candidatus Aenigmarchaeota archaeon]
MSIYAVKTIIGRENVVLEAMANKAKVNNLAIKALVHPEEIKGYIFVEGEMKDIVEVIKEIPHARGVINKPIDISEIRKMIETKKKEIMLKEGDIVEVMGGPFKGERGKVIRFDKDKKEVTIELIEVAVPIPITVNANLVSIIQKSGEEKNE